MISSEEARIASATGLRYKINKSIQDAVKEGNTRLTYDLSFCDIEFFKREIEPELRDLGYDVHTIVSSPGIISIEWTT